jgi:hypothetical protein
MHPLAAWARFLGVAAGYAIAFVALRRMMPFSLMSPWFAFVAMVCFLGLAFVAQPLVMLRMPSPLRAIRTWEIGDGLYRALGVPAFGRLLRRTPLRMFNRDVYFTNGPRDAARVTAELEAAEASHFWAAMLVVPYMAWLGLQAAWLPLAWIALAQALINLYPMMHLRLSRYRLDRIAARRSSENPGHA